MAQVHFLPPYAAVLEQVIVQAHQQGGVEVEVRPDVDPRIVAAQLRQFGADTGRPLRCTARRDRVEVRVAEHTGSRRAG